MILDKDYLTVKELADLIGVSRVAVFNKIKLGKIKAEKIGRNYIIYKENLPDMLNTSLSLADKEKIEKGVKKVLKDYGETIKMLGKE
jgi:excisionase family DNA binding protein